MNKNIFLLVIILIAAVGTYFFFINNGTRNAANSTEDGQQMTLCDGAGNRYESVAEAEAAGLTEAEYGATFCPEYVAAQTGNYIGLTATQAEEIAAMRQELFRIVEINGETQPTTRDFQEGRINAIIEDGVIIEYSIETNTPTPEDVQQTESSADNAIIGFTVAAAAEYATAQGVDFRTGTVDGVPMPVTMDLRPGRITADIQDGVVIGYRIE